MARSGASLYRITDPATRDVLKVVWDQLDLIQGSTSAPSWRGHVDAGANKLQNLAPGVAATDAVTKAQLDAATNHKTIAAALSVSGAAPLNVTNLIGAGSTIAYGTHALRLATPATTGNWFFETDRLYLYSANPTNQWVFAAGSNLASGASRPADLGANDAGALFIQQDTNLAGGGATGGNVLWWWNGGNWDYGGGTLYGDLANKPAATHAILGMRYSAVDFNRTYVCIETAGPVNSWVDAPGEDARYIVGLFAAAPGAGWHICDGTVGVTASTSTGGTTTITAPNLTGGVYMAAAGVVVTGTFHEGAGTANAFATFLPYIRL